jgi:hypothetical protein
MPERKRQASYFIIKTERAHHAGFYCLCRKTIIRTENN